MIKSRGVISLIGWMLFHGELAWASSPQGLNYLRVIEQFGKFHPMILHFPIALITLLPLVLIVSSFNFGRLWLPTIPYFIHLGTISAIGTVTLGYAALLSMQNISPQLLWHRNFSFATTGCMIIMSLFLIIKKPDYQRGVPRSLWVMSFLAVILLTAGAHLGAEVIHGQTFILFDQPDNAADYR